MNKISKLCAMIAVSITMVSCGNKSQDVFIGKWQDVNESSSYFTISKTDKGLALIASNESSPIDIQIDGNNIVVDGATLTFDEKDNQLSLPGLFDTKIIFKKVNTEQK